MDKILYHYCNTQKMYGIMSGRQLRMSDITKSNDYNEVYMFFSRYNRCYERCIL